MSHSLKLIALLSCLFLFSNNTAVFAFDFYQQEKNQSQTQAQKQEKKQKQNQQRKQQQNKEKVKKEKVLNSPVREEIQRYLGYETLPIRYLSLPYDMTVNSNIRGKHVDIGYLFLMFIPFILILGFVNRPSIGMLIMAVCLFLLLISTCTSNIVGLDRQNIAVNEASLNNFIEAVPFGDAPASVACAYMYKAMLPLFNPINSLVNKFSGDKDYITYPLLLILFVGLFYLIQERISEKKLPTRTMINFLYLFGFLWLILASGIIWYGFLMLPLGILILVASMSHLQDKDRLNLVNRSVFNIFVVAVIAWIGISYMNRISNVRPGVIDENATRFLFDPGIAKYQTGEITPQQALESYYPEINKALDLVNSDDQSLIYRIGTMFPFFIRKSDTRIFQDNQLGFFENVFNKYPNKAQLAEVLKASNFKYILVDLQTPSIDKTPEQSIVRKFNRFMNFLNQNPNLQLLATDRIIKRVSDNSSELQYFYDVFGDVHIYGNYAIYQIK